MEGADEGAWLGELINISFPQPQNPDHFYHSLSENLDDFYHIHYPKIDAASSNSFTGCLSLVQLLVR
jgi:hypothetical protein